MIQNGTALRMERIKSQNQLSPTPKNSKNTLNKTPQKQNQQNSYTPQKTSKYDHISTNNKNNLSTTAKKDTTQRDRSITPQKN